MMEISDKEKTLLIDLFNDCHTRQQWVSAEAFSAEHADEIEMIESLKRKNLISWDTVTDTYHAKFRVFLLVEDKLLNETLYVIERAFNNLRDLYIEDSGRGIRIDDLCKKMHQPRAQVIEALLYLKEITPFSISPDLDSADAVVIPTHVFMKYVAFNAIIDEQLGYLDTNVDLPEETKRLRSNQKAKLLSQAVAKTLWDIYPDMTIQDMCEHHSIQQYGGAKAYDKEKTVSRWLAEVAPEHIKK
ncbi:MAG: hypothetical protein WBN36_18400 [Gammaproteobacteria bacterium]